VRVESRSAGAANEPPATMRNDTLEQTHSDLVHTGHEALARGAWDEARARFEAALLAEESAEALEGLGIAAWWRDDAAVTFDARERAYRRYRQQGDRQGAARVATYLAYDYYSFRGEYAVANGWFQRAHRLLEDLDPLPEHAILAIYEGALALGLYSDTVTALRLSAHAGKVGRTLEVLDLEMFALALEGMARVSAGEIAAGMRCLDEATTAAVSGEMTDPDACASACCFLISACERVRDYERAAQWCTYVQDLCTRWNYALLFSLCRTQYAGVLMWRGDWPAAEATLVAANQDLLATRPPEAADGIVRLADLRRRQGRFGEAAALLARAEAHPFRKPGVDLALLGRAALALDQGDAAAAANLAERYLRAVPAENRLDRPAALELLAQAQIALGRVEEAANTHAELQSIAAAVATEPLRAAASFVEGALAAARGSYETARHRFEDAVDLYKRSDAPFETARAQIELACVLLTLGQIQDAGRQARRAQAALQPLGAVPEAERAGALLRSLETTPRARTAPDAGAAQLTPREMEVLRLVAAGKSNQEIAATLVRSVRTIERHVSNIYAKLGASGAVARVTATAYALRNGLTPLHPT
jgi:LuxR family transcriptional regulator, maltose regulon positive regulatory protein